MKAFLFLLLLSGRTLAATATASWDANPVEQNVSGYELQYGDQSGFYINSIAIENPVPVDGRVSVPVSALNAGVNYFFIVTAHTPEGLESEPSLQVAYTVPPDMPPAAITGLKWAATGDGLTLRATFDYKGEAVDGFRVYLGPTKKVKQSVSLPLAGMNQTPDGDSTILHVTIPIWLRSPHVCFSIAGYNALGEGPRTPVKCYP